MRPVLHGDVVTAARVLLRLPEGARVGQMRRMLEQATAADRYRKKLGRAHPFWGNGSLMAVAMGRPMAREPFLDDLAYCSCLALVFEALIGWRCENAGLNRSRNSHSSALSGQVPGAQTECPRHNRHNSRIHLHPYG